MLTYPIHIGPDSIAALCEDIARLAPSAVFVLADENTAAHVYPKLRNKLPRHELMVILPGETYKNLGTCQLIWAKMTALSLDRKALMLNVGGGVIGDMGGFVAATYKRGVRFMQVPTTLLSQVDASVGSKVGVDFEGYKNHLGVFADPHGVYIDPIFLDSLSDRELHSGFAEVIKHHLIADQAGWPSLLQIQDIRQIDFPSLIRHSVQIKSHIVQADPLEQGSRKALNFGHTFGHAIESEWLTRDQPFLHGEAIAAGMILEAYLSWKHGSLAELAYLEIRGLLERIFPVVPIAEADLSILIDHMVQDKKNEGGIILATLLRGIGNFRVNVPLSVEQAKQAFHHYRQVYGLD